MRRTSSVHPLVSIVTPSYNQGRFVEQTIESVLSQDYPNIEYIMMDGGSTDNTLEVLEKCEGRLRWFSEPDEGQPDTLNKGFELAKGQRYLLGSTPTTHGSTGARLLLCHRPLGRRRSMAPLGLLGDP